MLTSTYTSPLCTVNVSMHVSGQCVIVWERFSKTGRVGRNEFKLSLVALGFYLFQGADDAARCCPLLLRLSRFGSTSYVILI